MTFLFELFGHKININSENELIFLYYTRKQEGAETLVNIIKQELVIDEDIRKRIDFICSFTNTKANYFNGNLRRIDKTNLIYCEPHRGATRSILKRYS